MRRNDFNVRIPGPRSLHLMHGDWLAPLHGIQMDMVHGVYFFQTGLMVGTQLPNLGEVAFVSYPEKSHAIGRKRTLNENGLSLE